MVRINLA